MKANLIELKSIGHYLCPGKMEIYPIFADGKADYENALPAEEIDEANGISTEDLELTSRNIERTTNHENP